MLVFYFFLPCSSVLGTTNYILLIGQSKNDLIRKKIILFLLQDDVPLFVRFGVHQLKDFANRQNQINSILWTHREQDAPDNNKKRQQWTCTSTTGVILEL